nr:HD domain-containing phosphohydrolase [uncultured Holophaga sp.]
MGSVLTHRDTLDFLGRPGSLAQRLAGLHEALRQHFPAVHRLAVAACDPEAERVRTYLQSNEGESPLRHYEIPLEEAPGLRQLLASGRARVVEDLSSFDHGTHLHTRALREAGFASSYTLPFFWQGRPEAFIFMNSRMPGAFPEEALPELDLWGHLAGMLVVTEENAVRALLAALRTANRLVHLKDPETGGHLERMAAYTRVIARELASRGQQSFDDDLIETLAAFAPLHDVGKIGIPDAVLMKRGRLSEQEREVMQSHPSLGAEVVDTLVREFGVEHLEHIELLRHVTECHHELLDGSGYPVGLSGEQVPIAARIIAVADVFDALTSVRPYKSRWSNAEAFSFLRRQACGQLDLSCVEALLGREDEIERIQNAWRD